MFIGLNTLSSYAWASACHLTSLNATVQCLTASANDTQEQAIPRGLL